MRESKKGLLLVMLALFAALTLPMNTKAMTIDSTAPAKSTITKANVFSVSRSSVSVVKGKRTTVAISFAAPKAATVSAKASNKNISLRWATGWKANTNTLIITGVSTGVSTITIRNSYNTVVRKVKVNVVAATNPVKYRALVIGQADYVSANPLPACKCDAQAMGRACKKTGYSTVKVKYNASAANIKNLISVAYAGADRNDVSLFFYSGHGASGTGALCTIEPNGSTGFVPFSTLATWLKKVPGTVIVMLDSCYSGVCINKTADGKISVTQDKSITAKDVNNINTLAINEFKKADAQVKATEKNGELCTSKFRVITACTKNQTSVCYSDFSVFSYCIVEGAGVNYETGALRSTIPADLNKNRIVTVNEAWNCVKVNTTNLTQDTQVYPTNSSTRVFKR